MRYFLQRLLQFVIVFFLVTFGVMVLMRIGHEQAGRPGPHDARRHGQATRAEAVNAKYHLDANLFVQYGYWLKGMLHGDIGISHPAEHSPSPRTSSTGCW